MERMKGNNKEPARGRVFDETKLRENDLRKCAFHEAGHAVVYWTLGVRCKIRLEENENGSEDETFVTGFVKPNPVRLSSSNPPEISMHEISNRQNAVVGMAGRLSELILENGDERIDPEDAPYFLEDSTPSESDLRLIRKFSEAPLDDPVFFEIAEEALDLLYEKWQILEKLAAHLIEMFHDEGEVYLVEDDCWTLLEGFGLSSG